MNASGFDEANLVIGPPPGVSESVVSSLNVYRGPCREGCCPEVTISCFKVTGDELVEINSTGRVWLTVVGRMLPVKLDGCSPFARNANVS